MDIIWWQSNLKNFGDELNKDFWLRLFGDKIRKELPGQAILGIGSILNFDTKAYQTVHVLGSGAKSGYLNHLDKSRYIFWFVRGPLTAHALGLTKSDYITDPAIIVSDLYEFDKSNSLSHNVTFVPHLATALNADWQIACERVDIQYCSPMSPLVDICNTISRSSVVITESLHGAIIADQYRVPWIPVGAAHTLREQFKWHDWCQSMGLSYNPFSLPRLSLRELSWIKQVTNRFKFNLAENNIGPSRWLNRSYDVHSDQDVSDAATLLIKIVQTGSRQLSEESHNISLKQRMYERFMDFEKKILS